MLTLAWSYLAHSGKGYKIDDVIHTPCVAVTEVEYLTRIGERFLAGEKSKSPISDHAISDHAISDHAVLRFSTKAPGD